MAAFGALCLSLLPFAGAAGAATPTVGVYGAQGSGSGVLVTAGLQKSILGETPVQLGGPYTATEIGSLGDGFGGAVAAQVFPGPVAVGALGCDFRPLPPRPAPEPDGAQFNDFFEQIATPLNSIISGGLRTMWVQARYPKAGTCDEEDFGTFTPTENTLLTDGLGIPSLEEATGGQSKAITDRIGARQGDHRTTAGLGSGHAEVQSQSVALRQDPASPPIAKIGQVTTDNDARWTGDGVSHTVKVTAKNVRLFDGMLVIDKIVSEATTTSDGITGTAATKFTIGKAMLKAGGQEIEVAIDNEGIHVKGTPEEADQSQDLSHEDQINEAFTQAGITLKVMKGTEVVDGANGEASVGGLFLGVRTSLPNVPVPANVGPVPVASTLQGILGSLPKRCLSDFDEQLPGLCVGGNETIPTTCLTDLAPVPLPLCFGKGVLPGPGSGVAVSLSIASVTSQAAGGIVPPFDGGGGCVGALCGGGGGGTFIPGTPGIPAVPGTEGQTIGGGNGTAAAPVGPTGLLGLVARLPSGALAGIGAGFLVLAVGLQMRPSFRA